MCVIEYEIDKLFFTELTAKKYKYNIVLQYLRNYDQFIGVTAI